MSDIHCNALRVNLAVLALVGLAGCSSFNGATNRVAGIVSPYKMDIVQGNVVTREQVALLKPGMQRAQVRDILGTALLVSVFHADRWDYVFALKQKGEQSQARKVTVFFKEGVMDRVEADELPSESEFVATLKSPVSNAKAPALEASEEALKKYPSPTKPAPVPGPLVVPTDYPPLETTRP
jgi:outer membrane protein assembly factor BamE